MTRTQPAASPCLSATQLVTLLARRDPQADWGIRSRLSDDNYRARNGIISIQQLMDIAEVAKTRWQVHEPYTEFKIQVHM